MTRTRGGANGTVQHLVLASATSCTVLHIEIATLVSANAMLK
jgi:hypothetical protein